MESTKRRSRLRSLAIRIVLTAAGFALIAVFLGARTHGNQAPHLARNLVVLAGLGVPLVSFVAVWPRLAQVLEVFSRPLVSLLKGDLRWRRKRHSQRRAEHRLAMKELVINYATRHP